MIGRVFRFHGHGSLRYVYRNGKTVRGPLCALKYVRNERRDKYRLAIVVSKKVHKSAVVRNRIRRRIYEVFRQEAPRITDAYDMVLTVFSDTIGTLEPEELRRVIRAQLKQAGIIS
jgi:ribonuclease P protein component